MGRLAATVALLLALAGSLVAEDGGRIRGSAVDETGSLCRA
jgi:hypothetical protein